MKKNMGGADRIIRLLLSIVMAALALTGFVSGTAANIILAIAAIFLLTSAVGMCPVYSLIGLNTYSGNKTI